jgi:LPXTG-site transpeptidase (sortase) family protein
MPSRTRLLRTVLFCFLFAGLTLMLWPLGQSAFGWWNQRALHAAWQQEAVRPEKASAQNPTLKSPQKIHTQKLIKEVKTSKPKAVAHKKKPSRSATLRAAKWVPTRIVIPEINIDAVVVQGMSDAALRRGPGHDPRSVLPGQPGNCVIAGHRNVFGAWFANLDRLWAGSVIELHTPGQTFTYHVLSSVEVSETDTSVLKNDPHDPTPRLTLITCTLPASLYRHVVTAELAS